MSRVRVGVLISGQGSNMEALIRGAGEAYEVALVVSNKPSAAGLARAETLGVATVVVDHTLYDSREAHEAAVDEALRAAGCEVVALAGYMRILTPVLVGAWEGRMLNIHPSLLPKHPGLDTHRRALEAGDTEAGCSVHLVTAGVDEGPILAQARVPILPNDTPEALAARVLAEEHCLYPRTIAAFVSETKKAGKVAPAGPNLSVERQP